MPYPDLTDCTASELADLIRGKQLSPVEVTAHFLERISRYNDELRAFITTAPEHAMAEAHRAEAAVIAGDALGPFHGVPIGIKDLSDTKGIRTTYGSLLFGENVPTHDNIAVERIRASGAIIAGKTNTPDFGWKGTTESTIIGACANPWDTSRTSGGSSGGAAAALAARLLPLCDGSDAGGSIRIPSSFCGTYGIKPTMGRVPAGYTRPGWGMLSQNGPLATNVRDAAMMLNVLAGPDQRDARALPSAPPDFTAALEHPTVAGLRIAWSPAMDDQPVDAEVRSLTQAAAGVFETLGADVEEDAPLISTEDAIWAFSTMMLTDMALTLGPAIEAGQGDFLPAQLLKWLTQAMTWPATRYSQALHLREWHRQRFDETLRAVRSTRDAHDGDSRLPYRTQPENNRWARRSSGLGVHSLLPARQPHRTARRQHPLRIHRGRPARRPYADRTHGRRGDDPARVCGARGCPAMVAQAAARVPLTPRWSIPPTA